MRRTLLLLSTMALALLLAGGVALAATTTFTNSSAKQIVDASFPNPGLADPYPSQISVQNLSGNITDANLIGAMLLLASGIALAAVIQCVPGVQCSGTSFSDQITKSRSNIKTRFRKRKSLLGLFQSSKMFLLFLTSVSVLALVLFLSISGTTQNNVVRADELTSLNPVADTFVNENNPSTNYGTRTTMAVDNSPEKISYLKFDLSTLSGRTVLAAKLRLRVAGGSSKTNQTIKQVNNISWSETGMTFNNRPSLASTALATIKGGAANTWVEIDITSFIAANTGRVVSFGLDTTGNDRINFNTRESANKPVLVLALQSLATPTPPPTTTPALPTDSPSDSLSITDFGATPNDITDDTAAINSAISAARSQGKGVFVPAGTFRHRAFMLDGVKMHGTGDNSLLYAPDPSDATIDLRGNNVQLKDLKVQTPSSTRIVNQDAVRTHDAIDFLIQNVTVDGSNAAGIIMGVSGPGKVLNNRVINTQADAIHMTDATHDVVVDGNTVRNSADDMIAVVSYRHSPVPLSQNILIQNNNVDDGDTRGITVVGGKNVTIQNNTIGHTPHGAGVYLAAEESFNTFAVENILVRNNTLNFNDGAPEYHGAILAFASGGYGPNTRIHIDNNTINNPFAYGVASEGDNRNIAITNNKMYNVPHVPIHIINNPNTPSNNPTNVHCAGNPVDNSPYTKNCGGTFNFTVTGSTLMHP